MPPSLSSIAAAACLPATLALVAAGCGEGGNESTTTFTDSAGVVIATHTGGDVPLDPVFVEEFRLGGSETRPEEAFYGVHRANVGVDDQGRIHVLDNAAHLVVVFDDQGRHIRTLGGQGGGPGEIGMPGGLAISAEGGVAVIDFSRRGFARWDADGEILPGLSFPEGFFGGYVHLSGASIVVDVRRPNGLTSLVRIDGDSTATLADAPPTEMSQVQLRSCGMGFSGMPPVFAPTLRWSASGTRTVVAGSADYDLAVFEGDALVRRIRRPVAPRPATERLAIEDQGEGMQVRLESGIVTCDPAEFVEQVGFEPVIPAVGSIALAPDGAIWVERGGVRGEPRAIDLFSAEGEYQGTMPPGTPFPVAFFPDGRIAAGETDELDVTRLVVYRVER